MTSAEVMTLNEQLSAQTGVKVDELAKAATLYTAPLHTLALDKALDALRAIMMAGTMPRAPGHIITAILRNTSTMPSQSVNGQAPREEQPGCEQCRFTGAMEVPHHKDFDINGFWKGEHTMVVSCDCPKGLEKNVGMSIRTYDAMRPNWREEYPIRKYEFRQQSLIRKIEREEDSHRKAGLQSTLQLVNQDLMNLIARNEAA